MPVGFHKVDLHQMARGRIFVQNMIGRLFVQQEGSHLRARALDSLHFPLDETWVSGEFPDVQSDALRGDPDAVALLPILWELNAPPGIGGRGADGDRGS